MIAKLQELNGRKSNFQQNIVNFFDELESERRSNTSQFEEDPLLKVHKV